ncbi:MAG: hypothetical protein KDA22_00105 [Phycisphaerales bacterium]|nr:hypothetical protein [Phycisphaerales bacterium]
MLLHIEHDAAALAMLLDSPPPECASVAVRLGAPSEVLGFRIGGNPLDPRDDAEPWAFDPSLPGSLVFTWSGTLAPEPFAPDPRNWTRQGQEAFAAFCDQVRPAMEREERTLCVQPHARHALSDVQGALNFLRTRNGQPFGVAFAPASILTGSMLMEVDDHLTRAFETLGPLASAVVLEDVRPAPSAEDNDAVQAVGLGEGILPRELVRRLLEAHVPAETPLVIRSGAIDRQLAWLKGD